MKDTDPEINDLIFQKTMARSGGERMMMGMEMQAMARALVWSSIPKELPEEERRRLFYHRFFGEKAPF